MSPNVNTGKSRPPVGDAQIAAANETVRAFLGPQLPWMTRGSGTASTAKPVAPRAPRAQLTGVHPPQPVPVLPSPAPSDEPSPNLPNLIESPGMQSAIVPDMSGHAPIVSSPGVVTEMQSLRMAERKMAPPITPAQEPLPPPSTLPVEEAARPDPAPDSATAPTLAPVSAPAPSPAPAPVPTVDTSVARPLLSQNSQRTSSTSGPFSPFVFQAGANPSPVQAQDQNAGPVGQSPRVGRVSRASVSEQSSNMNEGEQPPAKRPRIGSRESNARLFSEARANLEGFIQSHGGIDTFSLNLEIPRLQLLKDSCTLQDGVFLVLHQMFCIWSANRAQAAAYLGLNPEVANRGFMALELILMQNESLSQDTWRFFMQFPVPLPTIAGYSDYASIFKEVSAFVFHYTANNETLNRLVLDRGYPILAEELLAWLCCYSRSLQGILFTASRRSLGIHSGGVAQGLDRVFCEDQKRLWSEDLAIFRQSLFPFNKSKGLLNMELQRRNPETIRLYKAVLSMARPQVPRPSVSEPSPRDPNLVSPGSPLLPMFNHQDPAHMPGAPGQVQIPFNQGPMNQQMPINQNPMNQRIPVNQSPVHMSANQGPTNQQVPVNGPGPWNQRIPLSQGPMPLPRGPPLALQNPMMNGPKRPFSPNPNGAFNTHGPEPPQQHIVPIVPANGPPPGQPGPGHLNHTAPNRPELVNQFGQPLVGPQSGNWAPSHSPGMPHTPNSFTMPPPQEQQHFSPQMPAGQVPHPSSPHSHFQLRPGMGFQPPPRNPIRTTHRPPSNQGPAQQALFNPPPPNPAPNQVLPSQALPNQRRPTMTNQQPVARPAVPIHPSLRNSNQNSPSPTTLAPSPLFFPRPGYEIARALWPHDVTEQKSISMSLHQADVRSPLRIVRAAPGTSKPERHYQYVRRFLVGPVHVAPSDRVIQFKFTVSPAQFSLLSKKASSSNGAPPTMLCYDGSTRLRVRCCVKSNADTPTQQQWVTMDTDWPPNTLMSLNGRPLSLRRRTHNGKDMPAEITNLVVQGENLIQLSISRLRDKEPTGSYFAAVEEIATTAHSTLMKGIEGNSIMPANTTMEEIKRRLSGTNSQDDDLVVQASDFSIDLSDPFMTTIFTIPARGRECTHLECFDLETWLDTRPTKTINTCLHKTTCNCAKDLEPSHPDKWRCPICFKDARPCNLRIDGFLLEVRRKLAADNKLGVKRITVAADGTWTPVITSEIATPDGYDTDEEMAPFNRRSASARSKRSSGPADVVVLDD